MENKTEDEIRKRWEQEAKDKADQEEETQQRPKKRVRVIEYKGSAGSLEDELEAAQIPTRNKIPRAPVGGVAAKKTGRAAAGRARGKVTEILEEEDDMVVELD